MLKQILGTISTRYLVAFLNLGLIFINAKVLGLEGMGIIGLIGACITIILVFNSLLSSNTLVYFINKYPVGSILPIAYVWSFAGAGIATIVMHTAGMIPGGYTIHVYFIGVINSLATVNSRLLLGHENIKGFNLTLVLQGGLLFFFVLLFYYGLNKKEVQSYVWGLYITNVIAWIVSWFLFSPYLSKKKKELQTHSISLKNLLKEMTAYGLWGSLDNLAETATIRLNYFLVEYYCGISSVGLLDAGTKIAESVWHISRSIGFIEYSHIAKTNDKGTQVRITLQLFKLSCMVVSGLIVVILFIPEWFYTNYLFSAQFTGIRAIITALAPGIIALSCFTILSNYFIGTGKIKYSAFASFTGFLFLLTGGNLLIPSYGVTGAAIGASIAYISILTFSFFVFNYQTGTRLKNYFLSGEEVAYIKKLIRKN